MRVIRKWFSERCIVKKGSYRVVVDFIRLGFVVKLPIIRFVSVGRLLKSFVFESRICPELFKQIVLLFTLPVDLTDVGGVRMFLFKGLMDNWREFLFYVATRHPFAHPTYFSLFGLVNVQRRGESPKMEREEFVRKMRGIIGGKYFNSDAHHFSVRSNFCVIDGRLRILDYGSPQTRKVIREYGMCVHRNFQIDDPE